jgi:hypothetical protein
MIGLSIAQLVEPKFDLIVHTNRERESAHMNLLG